MCAVLLRKDEIKPRFKISSDPEWTNVGFWGNSVIPNDSVLRLGISRSVINGSLMWPRAFIQAYVQYIIMWCQLSWQMMFVVSVQET